MSQGPGMLLRSGVMYYPADPDPSSICIEDIAHALSMLCRFNGHSKFHYSVAQHSVLVASFLPPELALLGLMHDAAEAYTGDMIQPIKCIVHDYSWVGLRSWEAIAKRFDLFSYGLSDDLQLPPAVKEADMRALVTEARDVMGVANVRDSEFWPDLDPSPTTIERMSTEEAKSSFLSCWKQYSSAPSLTSYSSS